MIKAKKKKIFIITAAVVSPIVVTQVAAIPFYVKIHSDKVNLNVAFRVIPQNSLIENGAVDAYNSISNIDNHLKLITDNEPKPVIVPKEDPYNSNTLVSSVPIDKPKEELKDDPKDDDKLSLVPAEKEKEKEKEEPINKEPEEEVALDKSRPDPKPKDIIIEYNGLKLNANITEQPERVKYKSDVENRITNRVDYINNTIPDINKVEVTEGFRGDNKKKVVDKIEWEVNNTFRVFNEKESETFSVERWLDQNPSAKDKFKSYEAFLNRADIKDFLKTESQKEFDKKKEEYKNAKYQWYGWLLSNVDWNKIQASKNVEDYLAKGMTTSPDNVYINANGEFDSYAFSPLPGYNAVTSRMTRDNKEKRTFGYDSYYTRSPRSVLEGTYPGWNKVMISEEYGKKYDVQPEEDGINFFKLTNDKPEFGKNNGGIVVEINAGNSKGYAKTLELIKKLNASGEKITSYRIFNIGAKDSEQKFYKIFETLPKKLPQLELFFESTNTSAILALEDKEIDELSLYTSGNSLLDDWSFNPFALRNVAFINKLDYNVSSDYPRGAKIPTVITMDSIAFDPVNYKKGAEDAFREINLGLRMALFVRNNEPFFQGGFGPGLKPDHNEGGNSYATGLDLSRIPDLKSLKGMQFSFVKEGKRFDRKMRRLILYSDQKNFEIDVQEMNDSQFYKVMHLEGPPNPGEERLKFRGGVKVDGIYLSGKGKLSSEGTQNLETFYKEMGRGMFARIIVDPENKALFEDLTSRGYKVEYRNPDHNLKFN
ncbi:putative immunoglobulin-blocking virulence protein [Mycoplasmopsis alligatoris]|uniref:Membrane family protein n=1 Tax=Mycoplasmopsis alligatoris A21JP2 TaxID=747682 RepID=D4XVC9_9BACT|nr:putative immunoglobulin-blocking virulence protein [Mycoplasmopsis alligatoris]EFF41708.1 membrane family protein [Mycoplasmopsis alligatoris A21JP2]